MTLPPDSVRFDDARDQALTVAHDVAAEDLDVLLVRDVLGRFTLLVDNRRRQVPTGRVLAWRERLIEKLQPYASDPPVFLASDLFSADDLLNSDRVRPDPMHAPAAGEGTVSILDNTVIGEDWTQVSTPAPEADGSRTHRTALYGFKGGVGRTTATAVLARHLCDLGHVVLVIDLDLESPGIGPLLADGRPLPRYGLVDHLVESAVGNAGGLDLVAATGYTPRTGQGELWVAPARGRGKDDVRYSYVDKLNRAYADIPGTNFADRIQSAVYSCESAVARDSESGRRPDVVLLDSRAGIHDIAAVTISRLCDLALLFGLDNSQTWGGYDDLFAAWAFSGQAQAIREKLRMVAAMVPDSPQRPMDAYLESFRDRSWDCFSMLYDDTPGAEAGESLPSAFYPTLADDSAPHYPIPILFEPGMVGLDAAGTPGWQERAFVRAAYRDFLETATLLITADPQTD